MNWVYFLFVTSGVLVCLVHGMPTILLHKMAKEVGLLPQEVNNMELTGILLGMVGPMLIGFLCDYRRIDNMVMYEVNVAVMAVVSFICPMAQSYGTFLALVGVLGACLGKYRLVFISISSEMLMLLAIYRSGSTKHKTQIIKLNHLK